MTRRIVFRPSAQSDLLALFQYIARDSGVARARAYVARINAACQSLALFPERGTRRDDLSPGMRTIGFERRVTIAFRVIGDAVEILAVAYGGRAFEDEVRDQ
ncbi:type II toxin-antitoxin system RelE/ParE family toxin [Azospirillum sp. RWY-5-1]|uniref:Type II toxin-antitoxin system RelE/ParE family toxin n=1 Tax=Azospirillum oleiclasticum TaxID=2735135 RepID=A0ABX2T995_9PROT|nr:type II toxin-antitoxin system RelE/ParE family toxin [Azospirillum oleiclasticum]NYZ12676.1 type II toxin-antitoxin system RelE/ParE family toxin [Azospirillum oleiclasticum]NYZ19836.1 type II toxin-antitoxin system RelE/ParE family toxin [Azospirillum oleiclasticum]